MQPRVTAWGNKASKPLTEKPVGVAAAGETLSHRRVHWRDPQGARTYTKLPTQESAPQGPNLLMGSRGSD